MIKIGLRDARAHFGRFVMSIIAIALGVSFVVGSFCFREMMNNQVSDMMGTSADHDVYVRGSKEVKSDSSGLMAASSSSKTYNTINVDLASTIGDVRGVKSAEVVYSVFGTVMGMVVGVAAGAVIRAVYEADGLSVLSIPWDQLGVFLVLSILVGLIASVSPASRALKQPVLDAVASE